MRYLKEKEPSDMDPQTSVQNMDQKRKSPLRKYRERKYNFLHIVLKQEDKTFHRACAMEADSLGKIFEMNPRDRVQAVDRKSKSPPKRKCRENKYSFAYIVQKQEDERFRRECPFADNKDFIELCNSFQQFNRIDLAAVFKANNCNLQNAMSALPKSKRKIVASKMTKHSIPQKCTKLCVVIEYNWFQMSEMLINKKTLEEKLKPGKWNIYKNIFYKMKENRQVVDNDNKVDIVMLRLFELKKMVAKKITLKEYNTIDFHQLRAAEAHFIMEEAFHDYSTALRKYPDMKPSLKCITGRGRHSIGGIPVLKNKMVEYLKLYKIKHRLFDGYIRVYLESYRGGNVKMTNFQFCTD